MVSVPDCGDVAGFVGTRILSAQCRYDLLVNHFKPGPDYAFPRGINGRAFQLRWLVQYPWLAYSKQENGGFCLPCVLFSTRGYHGSDPGVLVSRPLTMFTKALELLRKHVDKAYHKEAVVKADEFLKVMTNKQPDIRSRLNQEMEDRVRSNRQKLASIFDTIIFCGRQNVPLRGHRDNLTDIEKDASGTRNHGNFHALLKFRVDAGDSTLGEHLSTAARNATYTSSVIQNEIIAVLADHIRDQIIAKVRAARWFTVVADEVTDAANKEQLSLVLRYVDSDELIVREDLVGFFECDTGITGRHLADKILGCLSSYGLDPINLRGQAYDGAGNMAGSVNGTAALITAQYPLALYLHCTSHCLNLAVVKSLQVTSVRNMMGVIDRAYRFFAAHPKRQRALEEAITSTQPASTHAKLKDNCRTRWVQRIDALQVFQTLHPSTVACMERICDDGTGLWSSDSLTDARSLQLAMTTTDFLCALVITNYCLNYLQTLTSNLQAEAKDIVAAVKEIDGVIATLQDVRDNISTHHRMWYSSVERMCSDVGTVPSLPRRSGRQIHRNNVPADTPSEYYCRSLSIPLFDHLLSEMRSRFSSHQQTALLGLSLVPSVLVTIPAEEVSTKVGQFVDMYVGDLPSPHCVVSELHCWQMKWQKQLKDHGQNSLPATSSETLRQTTCMFPNITTLIKILCTLPVTTCSAERYFSGLKRVKTAFRSCMTTERLSGLSLLHIHRDVPIDTTGAIDEFCRRHPRRLQMVNVLGD